MRLCTSILVIAFCMAMATNAVFASSNQTIMYKNQRGSTLELVFYPTFSDDVGIVNGTFTSAVGECKPDVGVALPLTGVYNGDVIGFTTNFPHCDGLVAMTGNLMDDDNNILMLYLYANRAADPRVVDWDSNIIGTDSYVRVK